VTTERPGLRKAANQIAAGEGADLEDVKMTNTGPIKVVAEVVMSWLGWSQGVASSAALSP
jgi:hypothetical protein